MKRLVAGLLVLGLVAMIVATPTPALAHGHGHHRHGHHHGHFVGGFAVGAFTGLVLGGIFAPRVYYAPPPVYQPAPVYVSPAPFYSGPVYVAPPPVCSDYWVEAYWTGSGWVPGHYQRVCR